MLFICVLCFYPISKHANLFTANHIELILVQRVDLSVGMEEYFVHKCVTTDAVAANSEADGGDVVPQTISAWADTGRCELVLVQESQQAHGASRPVLASVLAMVRLLHRTFRRCESLTP